LQTAVAPLGGFLVVATLFIGSSTSAAFVFAIDVGGLLAAVAFDAEFAGLLAIDELAIVLVVTTATFAGEFAGLTALFELAGALPHATANASSEKSAVSSKILIFIN